MSSGALFPTLVPGSRGSSSKYLVEFRAGKMSLKSSTVTSDKRKGLVYIQQTDDSLIHFCWKDRTSGNVEDDLIIFPDDCEFKRVSQCTTGRVYVLKFKAGSKRLFFWMQEPKTEKDEEHCRKVNEYLNNPPIPRALGGSGSGGHELSALGGDCGLQSLLGNMSHNQLMQLIGPTGLGGLGGLGALTGPGLASLLGSGGPPTSSSSSRPAVPKVPFSRGNLTFWFFPEDVSLLIQEASSAPGTKLQSLPPTPPIGEPLTKEFFLKELAMAFDLKDQLKDFKEEIKELFEELRDKIDTRFAKISDDMLGLVNVLTKRVSRIKDSLEDLNEANINLTSKTEVVQQKVENAEKKYIMIQYRQMELALRVRGLREDKQENLKQIFSEAFASLLGRPGAKFDWQIDKAYRVNSWLAKQKQLPRDIVIYFTTRELRNTILQESYKTKLQIGGQDLIVLKEIPSQMLRARRDYAFLVEELRNRQIQYRWDAPFGIILTFDRQRYRLNSVWKARDFYHNILKAGHPVPSGSRERSQEGQDRQQTTQLPDKMDHLSLLEAQGAMVQRPSRMITRRMEQQAKTQQLQQSPAIGQEATVISPKAVGGARPKVKQAMQEALKKLQEIKDDN